MTNYIFALGGMFAGFFIGRAFERLTDPTRRIQRRRLDAAAAAVSSEAIEAAQKEKPGV